MNETPHRDKITDTLLNRLVPPPNGVTVTDACLDAETAAAWVDGGLSPAELARVRAHAADCARCQALMAELARLEPAAAAADTRRPWWMWAVPLAAVAAMLALVVGLPRSTRTPAAPADSKLSLEPPPASREAHLEPAPAADAKKEDRRQTPAAGAAAQAAGKPTVRDKDVADALRAAAPAAAPVAVPPPASNAAAEPRAINQAAERGALGKTVALREIASPDPAIRWRIVGRALEQTRDAGATWTPVSTGAAAEWTAGAAPSATTCWVVGRAGAVARTTDGRTWTQIAFPVSTDLSSVQATDAQTASVTTADGRVFRTIDGGNTWTPGSLQDFRTTPFNE